MQPADIAPKDRLIVALDLPGVAEAEAMIARLGDSVTLLQDRLSARLCRRPAAGRASWRSAGKKVFVDLKLHDIGNTVARGVESVAKLGATFLTVHAYPQTMKAAVEARAGSGLKILAVTVLTSYDDGDLHAAGYRLSVSDLVEARAQQAQVLGVDGLVCSPEEAASLRKIVGHQMNLVTPGIRPAGAPTRRPEAHHDAGARDRRRRGLSGGRTADHRSRRSQGGGGCHSGGNRAGAGAEASEKGEQRDGKGILDRARRCSQRWTATRPTRQPTRRIFKKFGGRFVVRGGKFDGHRRPEPLAQRRDRIPGLRDRAGLLQLAGIPGKHQVRQPHSSADLVIIEGYDGPQP